MLLLADSLINFSDVMDPVNLPWFSLVALLIAIVVSCTMSVNVGVLAIVMAGFVGGVIAPAYGDKSTLKTVAAGFPVSLFLTLTGVTLLFMLAETNGTLSKIAHHAVRLCRGHASMVPLMFFALTAFLSTIGAGAIAASALVAPMAMVVAERMRIRSFLMAIMVGHGAVAGGLSPLAATGVIANAKMEEIGLPGYELQTYGNNLLANLIVVGLGYLMFGGLKLISRSRSSSYDAELGTPHRDSAPPDRFSWQQWLTIGVVAALILGVFIVDKSARNEAVGMFAFTAAAILIIGRAGDEKKALAGVPWGVILMVCGVSMLVTLAENTGGKKLFVDLLTQFSHPGLVTGEIAFISGFISVFSSTSGVVLPMFLKLVPELAANLKTDPVALAMSINVGSGLVDVSPVSTIGALCLAAAASESRKKLFNQLMTWGVSMSVVGALFCYIYFGLL